jgi:hypothetical protein
LSYERNFDGRHDLNAKIARMLGLPTQQSWKCPFSYKEQDMENIIAKLLYP